MRRVALVILAMSLAIAAMAEIKTRKEGKTLLVEFYYPKDTSLFGTDSLSLDYIMGDISEAFSLAATQKCNGIIFYDKDGGTSSVIVGKGVIHSPEAKLAEIRESIEGMWETQSIPGKVIGHSTVRTSGAKYRQETYLNGKLQSTYESDWSAGWFAPETSTYKSGGDTYVTKTFYVPPKSETKEIREPGTSRIIDGNVIYTRKMYRTP